MSLTNPHLTLDKFFAAPTPIIAVVFTWVVLTGNPNIEAMNKLITAAKSAENP